MATECSAGSAQSVDSNVRRAVPRTSSSRDVYLWTISTLFYLGGMLCAGLLVPASNRDLSGDDQTGRRSPFVIAFKLAGYKVVRGAELLQFTTL